MMLIGWVQVFGTGAFRTVVDCRWGRSVEERYVIGCLRPRSAISQFSAKRLFKIYDVIFVLYAGAQILAYFSRYELWELAVQIGFKSGLAILSGVNLRGRLPD